MVTIWKILVIFLFVVYTSGCSNTFIAVKPDINTGQFKTPVKLTDEENTIFSPINDLDEQVFNVLLTGINVAGDWAKEYRPFVKEMLENCGMDKFVSKSHLEDYVIANDLGASIPTLDNRIGYNRLTKYIGPYLIVATDLKNLGSDWWEFSITVYDPVSSTAKFHASKSAMNLAGMKEPILLPVFNSLKKWVDASRVNSISPKKEGLGI